jgi:hypothetical protein
MMTVEMTVAALDSYFRDDAQTIRFIRAFVATVLKMPTIENVERIARAKGIATGATAYQPLQDRRE